MACHGQNLRMLGNAGGVNQLLISCSFAAESCSSWTGDNRMIILTWRQVCCELGVLTRSVRNDFIPVIKSGQLILNFHLVAGQQVVGAEVFVWGWSEQDQSVLGTDGSQLASSQPCCCWLCWRALSWSICNRLGAPGAPVQTSVGLVGARCFCSLWGLDLVLPCWAGRVALLWHTWWWGLGQVPSVRCWEYGRTVGLSPTEVPKALRFSMSGPKGSEVGHLGNIRSTRAEYKDAVGLLLTGYSFRSEWVPQDLLWSLFTAGHIPASWFIVLLCPAAYGGGTWCWFPVPPYPWRMSSMYQLAAVVTSSAPCLPVNTIFPLWKRSFGDIIPMNEGIFLIKVIILKLSLISV